VTESSRIEKQKGVLYFQEYSKLVQTLNTEQKHIFYIILKWYRTLRKKKFKPSIFVTGGAGTGKSHLINAIIKMTKRENCRHCKENPEGTVLLMAPTGCAALNTSLRCVCL
jgi:predicted GTPase